MKSAILWVSHAKDLWCWEVSAKSYARFAKGFSYAKVIVPTGDVELFKPVADQCGIHLVGFDQHAEKPFLHHEVMVAYADLHFPEDTEAVFHFDSDQFFCTEVNASDWIVNGKIKITFRDFESCLKAPLHPDEERTFFGFTGKVIDFNRGQYLWKFAADVALGWPVIRSTMETWPIVHHRDVYARTRGIIENRHGGTFESYVFSCRNEFPQTFAEFDTIGAVAHMYFEEKYHWHNLETDGWPAPKTIGIWSHGGLDKPFNYPPELGGGVRTPREVYKHFGFWNE